MTSIDRTKILATLPYDITCRIETDMRSYLAELRKSGSAYLEWADMFLCKVCDSEMCYECVFVGIEETGVSSELLCPECIGRCELCMYPTRGNMCDNCWCDSAMRLG
jgi:hypothetical protein